MSVSAMALQKDTGATPADVPAGTTAYTCTRARGTAAHTPAIFVVHRSESTQLLSKLRRVCKKAPKCLTPQNVQAGYSNKGL